MEELRNPNESREKIVALKRKLEEVIELQKELMEKLSVKGLSPHFILNVLGNVLLPALIYQLKVEEILKEPDLASLVGMTEEHLNVGEKYMKLLMDNDSVLNAETTKDMDAWMNMTGVEGKWETEFDYAKRVLRENGISL